MRNKNMGWWIMVGFEIRPLHFLCLPAQEEEGK